MPGATLRYMDDTTRRVLEFEETHFFRHGDRKLTAIWRDLGLSGTEYARRLSMACDDVEACMAFPTLTNRLRRRREAGVRQRTARRAG